MMIIQSTSEQDTIKTAQNFAKTLRGDECISLKGTLGMGKSVFARALIQTLTETSDLDVPSPTFTLVQTYETELAPIYHFDCYRLEDPEELYELGWEDMLGSGIMLIEWPEKAGYLLPKKRVDITINTGENNPNHRSIEITEIG